MQFGRETEDGIFLALNWGHYCYVDCSSRCFRALKPLAARLITSISVKHKAEYRIKFVSLVEPSALINRFCK